MKTLLHGFWSVAAKEVLHLKRDTASLVIALLIPCIQLTLFGFAINFDIRHIPTVVVDTDRSRESRSYLCSLQNTHYVDITSYVDTPAQAEEALRRGSARVAIIISPDFARRSVPGDIPEVRILIDGSDNLVATNARLPFLPRSDIATEMATKMTTSLLPKDIDAQQRVDARINMLFNPQMRTSTFMIPGLIAVILQIVIVALTAFSLVREREQGTMEQLMVSPVGRLGLMLGKLAPYAVLAMVEMIAVLILGWFIFDVRIMGSVGLLLLLSLPFVIAALSQGLFISTIAQNQGQALQMTLLTMLPSILMSGFVFPRDTMPGVLYLVSNALPVTFFLEILRGIIVRGAGFADLWPSVLALLCITLVLLGLSTTRFRKSIV
jgi:ABC-type multidrug transport system permease subunit